MILKLKKPLEQRQFCMNNFQIETFFFLFNKGFLPVQLRYVEDVCFPSSSLQLPRRKKKKKLLRKIISIIISNIFVTGRLLARCQMFLTFSSVRFLASCVEAFEYRENPKKFHEKFISKKIGETKKIADLTHIINL